MKFIIIYGPPAVGKLTTAKELAAITGYKLFHNHMSVDVVRSLYEFGVPKFWKLVRDVRTMLIESAAEDDIDLIFTFVYDAGTDDELIKSYMKIVEDRGGEVLLVQLLTSKDNLKARVSEESRKEFKKMTSPESLQKWFDEYKLFEEIPERKSLVIDNSNMSAKEVAQKIVDEYKLPTVNS